MEKLVGRRSTVKSTTYDLEMVKAAAWTWYQRGCGREGMVIDESRNLRTRSTFNNPRPSRYKLEALKEGGRSPVEMNVPLLDEYEIERITLQLKSLLVQRGGKRKEVTKRKKLAAPVMSEKKAVLRVDGLWTRSALRVCSSKESDVLDGSILFRRRHGNGGGRRWRVAAETSTTDYVHVA